MKICAIGLRGIPDIMGGIESHCQELYPRLVKLGCEVTVIGRSPYLASEKSLFEGVKIKSLYSPKNKFLETILHTAFAIVYSAFFNRPDILHIHAIGPSILVPLAKLLGHKVVVTHHGADYKRQKWNKFAKAMLVSGEKMAIRFANNIMVVGRSLTEQLKASNVRHADKIKFVPNGTIANFDSNINESDFDAANYPFNKKGYILAVGRLVPEKGFDDLIAAYNKTDLHRTHKLVLVGGSDHEDDYYKGLISKASDNVIFLGKQDKSSVRILYRFASLFVLPSYHEGLPIVALEAISMGLPVLLSDIEPNRDMDLDSVHYFKVGNTDDLASKLILRDVKYDKNSILKIFDWDQIAKQTFDIMQQLKAN